MPRLDPCPHRPTCPGCPHFGVPGLAPEPRASLAALAAEAGIALEPARLGTPLGYRYRARLMVRGRTRSPKVGIFQAESHRIADIPRCPIHHPLVNEVATALREAIRATGISPYADRPHTGVVRSLQVVVERDSTTAQVVVVSNASHPASVEPLFAPLSDLLGDRLHSLWWNGNPERTNAILGPHWQRVSGPEDVCENFGGVAVHFPPGAFGQSHLQLADELVGRVRGWVEEGARVAELYAGCGVFGLGLLRLAERVTFNERNEHALAGLDRGIRARPATERERAFVAAGGAEHRLDALADADVVIVDPPRRGLDTEVIDALSVQRPKQLLYVSCDPASLVRDAERLTAGGFALRELHPFACFPYTNHAECAARFDVT